MREKCLAEKMQQQKKCVKQSQLKVDQCVACKEIRRIGYNNLATKKLWRNQLHVYAYVSDALTSQEVEVLGVVYTKYVTADHS